MAKRTIYEDGFKFVNELLESKENIIDQLTLLGEYKDRSDVQEYVKRIFDYEYERTDYFKYLFDKYYYGKDVEEPLKTGYDNCFEYYLRPFTKEERIYNPGKTDIKIGDEVVITDGPYNSLNGIVKDIYFEYSEFLITTKIFDKDIDIEVDFKDVKKI